MLSKSDMRHKSTFEDQDWLVDAYSWHVMIGLGRSSQLGRMRWLVSTQCTYNLLTITEAELYGHFAEFDTVLYTVYHK